MVRVIVKDVPVEPDMVVLENVPEYHFWESTEDDRWEFVEGTLFMHSPASLRHQDIVVFLVTLLKLFLGRRRAGTVTTAPAVMRLRPRRNFEPDIQVILAAHADRIRPECVEGAADLVIEVVSPGNATHDLDFKRKEYKEGGVPEAWFVDPAADRVVVSGAGVAEREVRTGPLRSHVIDGFAIDVAWVLAEPTPDPLECLSCMDRIAAP